jgi:hypothetical protein
MKRKYSTIEQNNQHTAACKIMSERLPFLTRTNSKLKDFTFEAQSFSVRTENYEFKRYGNFYVEYRTPNDKPGVPYEAEQKGITFLCHLMKEQHLFIFQTQPYVKTIESVRDGEKLNIRSVYGVIEQKNGTTGTGWAVPQAWMIEKVPCIAAINIWRDSDVKALEAFLKAGDTSRFEFTDQCLRTKEMERELTRAGIYLPAPKPESKKPQAAKLEQPQLMLG